MSGSLEFRPGPNEHITIGGKDYRFAELRKRAHVIVGREAKVFRLIGSGDLAAPAEYALKVFTSQEARDPSAVLRAKNLAALPSITGLTARTRDVLTSQNNRALLKEHPELSYAVKMPWIDGATWSELGSELRDNGSALSPQVALHLASNLLEILTRFEQGVIAHCDISAFNVIVQNALDPAQIQRIELIDLEQMFGPGLERPKVLAIGSKGYARADGRCVEWSADGDRYAGAVLIAEFLGYCHPLIVAAASSESSYFRPNEVGNPCHRYTLLREALRSIDPQLADRFAEAWSASSPSSCPTFDQWYLALPERAVEARPLPARAIDAARAIADAEQGEIARRIRALLPAPPKPKPPTVPQSKPKALPQVVEEKPATGNAPAPPPDKPPSTVFDRLVKYGVVGVLGVVAAAVAGCGLLAMIEWILPPPPDVPPPTAVVTGGTVAPPPTVATEADLPCATIEQRNGELLGEASGGSQMWNARLEPNQLASVTLRQTEFPCSGPDRMGFVVHTRSGTVNATSPEPCVWTAAFESGAGGLTPISLFYKDAGDTTTFELAVSCATSLSGG